MVSRLARVFPLALATALLIYYHSAVTRLFSIDSSGAQGYTTTVSQWPFTPKPPTADQVPAPSSLPDTTTDTTTTPPFSGIPQDNHAPDGSASAFNELKFPFQDDLPEYRQPVLAPGLTRYAAHNDRGPGQAAFATYLSTRNNSLQDPYFLAAQQLVHRLLWAPRSRSPTHPVVVFVAPFIPAAQRAILRAQGAIVRELELVAWDPTVTAPTPATGDGDGDGTPQDTSFPFARWRDLFSKLHMWAATDFARLAFLDLDAFPLAPLDALLTDAVAPRARCVAARLPPADAAAARETGLCDYVWAGTGGQGGINVGVVVFSPNAGMHARLLRESSSRSSSSSSGAEETGGGGDGPTWDRRMAEQAFLNYAFGEAGPFPPTAVLGREWNGYMPRAADEGRVRVVHEKLWSPWGLPAWAEGIFREGWEEMLGLYESAAFGAMRRLDGVVATDGEEEEDAR